jgi:hypothetical protein
MGRDFKGFLLSGCCITMWLFCFWDVNQLTMWQQWWYLLWFSPWDLYTTWAMYILGLSSSWGTSRIRPAWSLCEHQLTPALSPIWGPRPKPRRPEEVVYSPNDSCSHFTQRLFPPKLPQQHTCTILAYVHCHSYLLYTTFKQHLHPFIIRQIILLFLRLLLAGWLPSVSRVR